MEFYKLFYAAGQDNGGFNSQRDGILRPFLSIEMRICDVSIPNGMEFYLGL